MIEKAEFTLLKILLSHFHCKPDKDLNITNNDIMWNLSFRFSISPFPSDYQGIHIFMGFSLYKKNDPDKKTLAKIEIDNLFKTKGTLSISGKLKVINELLKITAANLRGIYAVKTEGTVYEEIIPSQINFRQYDEDFKRKIGEEWK